MSNRSTSIDMPPLWLWWVDFCVVQPRNLSGIEKYRNAYLFSLEFEFSHAKIRSHPKLFSSPFLMNFPDDQRLSRIEPCDRIIRQSMKFWFSFNAIKIKSNSLNSA